MNDIREQSTQLSEDQQQAVADDILGRLVGSTITVFGATETGEAMLFTMKDGVESFWKLLSDPDHGIGICEIKPHKEEPKTEPENQPA